MPHAIWNGSISFGLVTIPVSLVGAEETKERLSFHMLDGRDLSPVKEKRVNASTGEGVAWDDVVKGYDTGEGRWVVLTDDDFRSADAEATQTIDVLSAVCAGEIEPQYFERPYFLEPTKQGRKAYALLREALARAGRVALGKIVIRSRQRLVALVPQGDALLLEVLRYPHELRKADGLTLPGSIGDSEVTETELKIAGELIAAIEAPFDPGDDRYRDTYHEKLLELIGKKAAGLTVDAGAQAPATAPGEIVDIATLLKRSLELAKKSAG